MTKNDFIHLAIEDKNGRACLSLDGHEIKNIEFFEIKKSGEDGLLPGTTTLTLKMTVKYP